jgi:CRP/FNR family transcriptional regulator, anaerobic regulatory protein
MACGWFSGLSELSAKETTMLGMTLAPGPETNSAEFDLGVEEVGSSQYLGQRLKVAASKVLQARDHLFFEGDAKDHIYRVEKGTVCLYNTLADGRRQIVDFAYPGDLIGLGAPGEHMFSAQAITLTRLRCLPANLLLEVALRDPDVGMQLYRAMSDQLMAARDLLLTVGQRNATERLAALLFALSRRNARIGADPTRLVLPMTRADIADFLSLTIETVSRTFTKLRQAGIIELVQSSLVDIVDQSALERLAAGDVEGLK